MTDAIREADTRRTDAREAIYRRIDTILSEPDFDDLVAPTKPEFWEDRIAQHVENLSDERTWSEEEGEPMEPSAYRRHLARIAAEAVAAIEAHDKRQAEGAGGD